MKPLLAGSVLKQGKQKWIVTKVLTYMVWIRQENTDAIPIPREMAEEIWKKQHEV